MKADSAIFVVGYNSQKELYEQIRYEVPQVNLLGDARQVQNIMYAIWVAYEVVRDIYFTKVCDFFFQYPI